MSQQQRSRERQRRPPTGPRLTTLRRTSEEEEVSETSQEAWGGGNEQLAPLRRQRGALKPARIGGDGGRRHAPNQAPTAPAGRSLDIPRGPRNPCRQRDPFRNSGGHGKTIRKKNQRKRRRERSRRIASPPAPSSIKRPTTITTETQRGYRSAPEKLAEDHPLRVHLAALKTKREERSHYWAGVKEALGDEWRNPANYDVQLWKREEETAQTAIDEVGVQIGLLERGIPEEQIGLDKVVHESKESVAARLTRVINPRAPSKRAVSWSKKRRDHAVESWFKDMGLGDGRSPQSRLTEEDEERDGGTHGSMEPAPAFEDPPVTNPGSPTVRAVRAYTHDGVIVVVPRRAVDPLWDTDDEEQFEHAERERESLRAELARKMLGTSSASVDSVMADMNVDVDMDVEMDVLIKTEGYDRDRPRKGPNGSTDTSNGRERDNQDSTGGELKSSVVHVFDERTHVKHHPNSPSQIGSRHHHHHHHNAAAEDEIQIALIKTEDFDDDSDDGDLYSATPPRLRAAAAASTSASASASALAWIPEYPNPNNALQHHFPNPGRHPRQISSPSPNPSLSHPPQVSKNPHPKTIHTAPGSSTTHLDENLLLRNGGSTTTTTSPPPPPPPPPPAVVQPDPDPNTVSTRTPNHHHHHHPLHDLLKVKDQFFDDGSLRPALPGTAAARLRARRGQFIKR
ncbi:MAG: hypothetical protein M1837_002772 [Sclerophora amabilis]|nr:MAG: hypothetical protein M1837_002772 [Sclerophora amabilis]